MSNHEQEQELKIVRIDANNRNTDENKKLLQQYYTLRATAFQKLNDNDNDIYKKSCTEADARDSTVFILGVRDGKVVAGGNLNFSTPDDRCKLKFEEDSELLTVSNMLPTYANGTYAGLMGVASISNHPRDVIKIQKALFQDKSLKNIDVVIGISTPSNVLPSLMSAKSCQSPPVPMLVLNTVDTMVKGFRATVMVYSFNPEEQTKLESLDVTPAVEYAQKHRCNKTPQERALKDKQRAERVIEKNRENRNTVGDTVGDIIDISARGLPVKPTKFVRN